MDNQEFLFQGIELLVQYLETKENWSPKDFSLQATLLHLVPEDAGFRERRSTSREVRVRLLRMGNRLP